MDHWDATVSVEFTQEVEQPMYLSRFVKRLIHWQPPTPSVADVAQREIGNRARKRKVAAITPAPLPGDDTDLTSPEEEAYDDAAEKASMLSFEAKRAETLSEAVKNGENTSLYMERKMLANKARRAADAAEKKREEAEDIMEARLHGGSDPYKFSDVPMELDEKREELMTRLKAEIKSHHPEEQFNLEFNYPEMVEEAFDLAAERLFGDDAPVGLRLQHGGCNLHADDADGAKQLLMRLVYKDKEYAVDTGCLRDVCCGTANMPWGVKLTKVPVLKEAKIAAARAHFAQAMQAFGLRKAGEASWHLVTVVDGG